MLLTLAYLLLMAFAGLQFNIVIIGATAVLDALGLFVLAGIMGVGQNGSDEDLTDFP